MGMIRGVVIVGFALGLAPTVRTGTPSHCRTPVALRPPLAFEQAGDAYTARLGGVRAELFPDQTLFHLPHGDEPIVLRFAGAHATSKISALDALPGKANYLIGRDP